MSDARNEILARIHRATGRETGSRMTGSRETGSPPSDLWEEIPRVYRQSSSASPRAVIDLFKDRLHDYDAQVLESSSAGVARAIEAMLRARAVFRIVIPAGLQTSLLPEGFDFVEDIGLSHAELNGCEGILTECTLAIAETGTIVLQHVGGQGRRAATLIPDYHLCLVDAAKIVATVPEGIARLGPTAHLPTTFISGPSATADIEMTRIKGVHGPRFLDVVLLLD